MLFLISLVNLRKLSSAFRKILSCGKKFQIIGHNKKNRKRILGLNYLPLNPSIDIVQSSYEERGYEETRDNSGKLKEWRNEVYKTYNNEQQKVWRSLCRTVNRRERMLEKTAQCRHSIGDVTFTHTYDRL